MTAEEIVEKARGLPLPDRRRIVSELEKTFDIPELPGEELDEDEWARAWEPELRRRLKEIDRDPSIGNGWRTSIAEARAKLERRRSERNAQCGIDDDSRENR